MYFLLAALDVITVLVSFLIPGQAAIAVADGDPLTTGMALTAFSVIALSVLLGRLLLVIGVPIFVAFLILNVAGVRDVAMRLVAQRRSQPA